jgi:4-hydroxythreonine-4-phosphate dehydrogenase
MYLNMSNELQKHVRGITSGDLNGIGIELIIKSLSDHRILDICIPVDFSGNKIINFYRKSLPDYNFNYNTTKDLTKLSHKQVNLFSCWDDEVAIQPGVLNNIGGEYAYRSLEMAVKALKDGQIQGLVTAPIHKTNIQSEKFNYSGHSPYLKDQFQVNDGVMMMVTENMRVAVLTEHIPVKNIAHHITIENTIRKIKIMQQSLQTDFGIEKPRIAVLGLNPHAGDEGLIGNEEELLIKPAIKELKAANLLVFGPYSADAFFARGQYKSFDAVLAMYHDQGLIPFKSLAIGEGINYTAGLPDIRTSPDHGNAFDIAGKGKADPTSFLAAIFEAVDIIRTRQGYKDARTNPMKKMSARILANAVDEKVEE